MKDEPSKGMSWADACKQIGPQPITADGDWQPGLTSVTTSGAQFAEATVDVETGIVRVKRVLVLQDCGLVVSRLTAESQVYGGVIGSLNFALFEDRILDRNTGQMVNPNMEWYLLAGMSDIPADRGPDQGSAGAWRHRSRRAANGLNCGRGCARGEKCNWRDGAHSAANAGYDSAAPSNSRQKV